MDSKAEHYFDLHHERANNGADHQELDELLAKAHYYLRLAGCEGVIPAAADYGAMVIELERQAERPN